MRRGGHPPAPDLETSIMKTKLSATSALVLLIAACTPDAEPRGELEQTTGRTPQFENEYVEVWKSVIVPNQPLEMHRHDNPAPSSRSGAGP